MAIESLNGQTPAMPQWQIAAGGKLTFEVASVKTIEHMEPSKFRAPSFPLSNDEAFRPTGGRFIASFPLSVLITFAYKTRLTQEQMRSMLAPLPKWVSIDSFEIEARAEGNPTKDQFRLMMQSLLAERFKLVVHEESREVPLFALVPSKPGKPGPKLRPHSEGPPCDSSGPPAPPPATSDREIFPPSCDVQMLTRMPNGMQRAGSRNTTLALIAASLPTLGRLGRPVVDQTGLSGNFDFVLEWTPEPGGPALPNATPPADPPGPTFLEALREQLGLKLEPSKGPIEMLVIDHVERPSEN